jgi:hypothetical protein
MQSLVVVLLVLGCTVYAVWALLPNVMRRGVALRVMNWPWPGFIARKLQKAAQGASGCGCDGCDVKTKAAKPAGGVQPVQFHRGPRR